MVFLNYDRLDERAAELLQRGMKRDEIIDELEAEFPHTTTLTIMDAVDTAMELA